MHEVEKGLALIEKYGSLGAAPDKELVGIHKRCNECLGKKPITEFHRYGGRSSDGFRQVCIQCRRNKERARQQAKREQQAQDRAAGVIAVTAADLLPGDMFDEGSVVVSVHHGNDAVRVKLDDGGKVRFLKDEGMKVKRGGE